MYRQNVKLRATGGTRTPDQLITNQLLYQLSYSGLFVASKALIRYFNQRFFREKHTPPEKRVQR